MQKNKQLTEKEILDEIKRLSDISKELTGKQNSLFDGVSLGDEDLDSMFNIDMLNDTANPDQSHRLYYTMMMTLRNNLPKGKKNEKLRRYVYDEKSLFLNRGKEKDDRGIKHSDERQTYIPAFLKVAFDTVYKWVAEGANPYDIYSAFRELNLKNGYRNAEITSDKNDTNQLSFGDALTKISKAGKPKSKGDENE